MDSVLFQEEDKGDSYDLHMHVVGGMHIPVATFSLLFLFFPPCPENLMIFGKYISAFQEGFFRQTRSLRLMIMPPHFVCKNVFFESL